MKSEDPTGGNFRPSSMSGENNKPPKTSDNDDKGMRLAAFIVLIAIVVSIILILWQSLRQ